MNEIFSADFVTTQRKIIDTYLADRANRVTFPVFFNLGNWRALEKLDHYLEQANDAKHCTFIMIYLYNKMAGDGATSQNFIKMIQTLRQNIDSIIVSEDHGCHEQFRTTADTLKEAADKALSDYNHYATQKRAIIMNDDTYNGPSSAGLIEAIYAARAAAAAVDRTLTQWQPDESQPELSDSPTPVESISAGSETDEARPGNDDDAPLIIVDIEQKTIAALVEKPGNSEDLCVCSPW